MPGDSSQSASNDRETDDNWEWVFNPGMPAIPLAKKYRKHGKRLSTKMRRRLLKKVIENMIKESRSLVTRGGVVTRKTQIIPFQPGKEWDLEYSLDNMLSSNAYKLPSYRDLYSRDVIRSRRCFVILADKSNSLGPVIDYVALAVSIMAVAVQSEQYAVLLFDDYVREVKRVKSSKDYASVLEEILNIECKGATNLHLALTKAKEQLDAAPTASEGVCVMVTDCIPTCGDDPLKAAIDLPRLEILLVNNNACAIGSSCVDKLAKLQKVKVRSIKQLNDIVDAIQDIVSYGVDAV